MHYPKSSPGFLRACLLIIIFCNAIPAHAIKFKDDEAFFLTQLQKKDYKIDKNTPAIVLYEKISAVWGNGSQDVMATQVRRIIKVLNKDGHRYADVSIPILHEKDHEVQIRKVNGVTYNLEAGKMTTREMGDKNLQKKELPTLLTVKFSLPDVHEGSIIDYTYTIENDISLVFCSWSFQEEIPKLYSEVEVRLPKEFDVIAVTQMASPFENFSDKKADIFDESLPVSYTDRARDYAYGEDYFSQRWVRRNVAAVHDEPYTDNYKNYVESIQLQLTGVSGDMFQKHFLDNWERFNKHFYEHKDYYKALKNLPKEARDKAARLTAGQADKLQKAKAIYSYVRGNFRPSGSSVYIDESLSKVFEDRSGSPSEINLLLVAMLKEAELNAEPVIIATHDVLRPLPQLPVLSRFDHTICRLQINDSNIYLDASEPYLPFGILSPESYYGAGRLVSAKPAMIILYPELLKEREHIMITTDSVAGSKLYLNVKRYFGTLAGAKARGTWMKDSASAIADLKKDIKGFPGSCVLLHHAMHNLYNLDTVLVQSYRISMDLKQNNGEFLFSPNFYPVMESNPFKSSQRNYPINLQHITDVNCTIDLKLPEQIELVEAPKPLMVEIDAKNQFKYLVDYNKADHKLRINSRLQMRRASFEVEEYETLKVFFDKIMELQQSSCVLKSKS